MEIWEAKVLSPTHVKHVPNRNEPVLLSFLLLCLIAATIRALPLFEPALWFDEAFSIFYVQKGLGAIWGADWHLEPTPPLYYSLLWAWTKLFGNSEPVLRSLSLIASSLATGVIYLAGRELSGPRAGIGAALIWALLPLSIDYGLEIRAYALEFLLISILTLVFIRLTLGMTQRKDDKTFLISRLIQFTALGLVVSYTHITAILAFTAFVLIAAATVALRRREMMKPFLLAMAVYAVGLLPQVYASYAVMSRNAPTLAWLTPPNTMDIVAIARAMLVGQVAWGSWLARVALAVWFATGALALFALRRSMNLLAPTLFVALTGFVIFVAFSRIKPVMLNRTSLWMMIPVILFVSAGLSRLPRVASLAAFAMLLVGITPVAYLNFKERTAQRGDYRGIDDVAADAGHSHLIVTVDGELACEFVYFRPNSYPQLRLADIGALQEFQRTQRVDLSCNQPPSIDREAMTRELAQGHNIWIVGRMPFYENGARMRRDVDRIRDLLAEVSTETRRVENESFIGVRMSPK